MTEILLQGSVNAWPPTKPPASSCPAYRRPQQQQSQTLDPPPLLASPPSSSNANNAKHITTSSQQQPSGNGAYSFSSYEASGSSYANNGQSQHTQSSGSGTPSDGTSQQDNGHNDNSGNEGDGHDDHSPSSSSKGKRQRSYQCLVAGCGKLFYQRAHLKIHERSHTGFRPYKCPFKDCDKSFTQLGNLKTHERKHTGERPYKCTHAGCGKAFSQLGNLRTHERTHLDVKPFPCDVPGCNKQFTQMGNLRTHQRKLHGLDMSPKTAGDSPARRRAVTVGTNSPSTPTATKATSTGRRGRKRTLDSSSATGAKEAAEPLAKVSAVEPIAASPVPPNNNGSPMLGSQHHVQGNMPKPNGNDTTPSPMAHFAKAGPKLNHASPSLPSVLQLPQGVTAASQQGFLMPFSTHQAVPAASTTGVDMLKNLRGILERRQQLSVTAHQYPVSSPALVAAAAAAVGNGGGNHPHSNPSHHISPVQLPQQAPLPSASTSTLPVSSHPAMGLHLANNAALNFAQPHAQLSQHQHLAHHRPQQQSPHLHRPPPPSTSQQQHHAAMFLHGQATAMPPQNSTNPSQQPYYH
ncbi:hypothetical protein H4R35_004517 [Dimargaris xerosporica]|nr:hypothetical protein H4R35_004517 [Dimargaris xerosporica]